MAPVPPTALREEGLANLVKLFGLLADRSRLRIVFTLAREGEQNVTALCALLGQSQPAVSHHLKQLRRCGLLSLRRQGKHNFYSLAPGRLWQFLEPLLNDPTTNPWQLLLGEVVVTLRSP
jgi:DNA-binding transcriptional ArsR family regulator